MPDRYIGNRDLRPCDGCGGALGPCFTVRTDRLAVMDHERANQHLGLTQMLGGTPVAEMVADALGPGAVYRLAEDSIERFLCQGCTRGG